MKCYGLIGKTLIHSKSKQYFDERFAKAHLTDCHYELFELTDIHNIRAFLSEKPNLQGFNITIPYKRVIMPYLDETDSIARAVGAVNCVRVSRAGGIMRLHGFNTDVAGFRESLAGKELPGPALILGTGGAAVAVAYVLQEAGIACRFVSRAAQSDYLTYKTLTEEVVRSHPFIINCTPIGMFPRDGDAPALPYSALTPRHFLYDLIYNPPLTRFMAEGLRHHTRIQNGLKMLYLQADASWRVFGLPF